LQRDLLEPRTLFFVQDRVDGLLSGFAALVKSLGPLVAAGVAQARESFSLLGGELGNLLDLFFAELEVFLDRLLAQQHRSAAGTSRSSAETSRAAFLGQRGGCGRDERGAQK
jgi:hypothetical protein